VEAKVFGERVRTARKMRGLTQMGLANKMKLGGTSTVSKWEVGKVPPTEENIKKAAEALDIPWWWLVLSDEDLQTIVAMKGHLAMLQGGKDGHVTGCGPSSNRKKSKPSFAGRRDIRDLCMEARPKSAQA
jgi:DNA-binding XRE family transcriptional regulator